MCRLLGQLVGRKLLGDIAADFACFEVGAIPSNAQGDGFIPVGPLRVPCKGKGKAADLSGVNIFHTRLDEAGESLAALF